MEENFKQTVRQAIKSFKSKQVQKADGDIDLLLRLHQQLSPLDTFIEESTLEAARLRDELIVMISKSENLSKDQAASLNKKITKAYKEAQEPSKLDAVAEVASAAIGSAKETASSLAGSAKKLLRTISRPRFFRAPASDEFSRPIMAPNANGFSRTDSPSSASPSQSGKLVRNKRRNTRRTAEVLPPLPVSAELTDLQSPPVSEQVALPTQNIDEEARRAEEERKAQEAAAELKRQEEAAEKARLEKEAEERRLEEERQKAEQERLRKIEEAEQARLKQIEDERKAKEAAERAIQEAQRRAQEEAAEQKRLEEEQKQKLIDKKAKIEARLAEIPRELKEKDAQLKDKQKALGLLNTKNEEIRNDFYLNYVLRDLKAKRESLVPIKFLFKGRLSVLEKEGGNYISATTDEDKSKIVDKLANTGIYRFEFVRQALSSFYKKRKTSYKKYLEMCEGAEQIKNNMKGDESAIHGALLPLTLCDFSTATNAEFKGENTATKQRLLDGKPFGTKEWLVHHLEKKAKLNQNVQQLEQDIVALQNEIPQCNHRLAELNAQLNPGRQEQVDPIPDKSSAFTL